MKLALFAALLVASLATSYGLQCFVCDGGDSSVADSDCGDTFNEEQISLVTTCPTGQKYCKKKKSGVNHVYNRIVRSCAAECVEQNNAYVDRTTCCTTDKCNSGNGLVPMVGLVLAIAAFLAMN